MHITIFTYIIAQHSSSKQNRTFLWFIATMIWWVFSDILLELNLVVNYRIEILKIGSIGWLCIGITASNFTFAYLDKGKNWFLTYLKIITPSFILLSLGTDWIVAGVKWKIRGWHIVQGWLQPVSVFMTVNISLFYILVLLIKRLKTEESPLFRKQILVVCSSFILSGVLSTLFDVFLPKYFGIEDFVLLASAVSGVTILIIFIAIIRYRFMLLNFQEVSQKIFSDIGDGVILLNNHNFIVDMNPSAEKILNLEKPLSSSTPAKDIIPMDWLDFKTSQEVQIEGETKRNLMISKDIIHGQKTTGTLIFLRDITEQKTAEEVKIVNERLRLSNENLESLNKTKEELISVVSHELRTPIVSILGYAETMVDCELSSYQQNNFLTIIIEESERLSRLIGNFLDVSNFSTGMYDFQFKKEQFNQLAEKSVALLKGLAREKNISIQNKVPPICFTGDGERITQVLLNIIGNSIKFSPHGGTITIDSEQKKTDFKITIEDEGGGIPVDEIVTVFNRLHKKDRGHGLGGAGLGLHISKQIIEGHQGVIAATNTHKGALFHFTIPYDQHS